MPSSFEKREPDIHRSAGELDAGGADVGPAEALDAMLGRTVPNMPRLKAVARRLRRIYLYLFGVQLVAWVLKLSSHPGPVASPGVLVERAQIGSLPGALIAGLATAAFLAGLVLAFRLGGVDRDPS